MKYLKKFFELNTNTYNSAISKFRDLGHNDRADNLDSWVKKIELEDSINKYKEFGKFTLNIQDKDKINHKKDFYLNISLTPAIEGKDSVADNFHYYISIIPTDFDTLLFCNNNFKECLFHDGFQGMLLDIDVDLSNDEFKIKSIELSEFDSAMSGYISIADRNSAGRFKNLLVKMFSNKITYPHSIYHGDDYKTFYDELNLMIGAEYGFTTDYGFEPELISNYIKNMSANHLYETVPEGTEKKRRRNIRPLGFMDDDYDWNRIYIH